MLECWGGSFCGGSLNKLIKIGIVAEELGVCAKTIYNWISRGVLKTAEPGFVTRADAKQAHANQKQRISEASRFRISQGTRRDANGRFVSTLKNGS
jgi:transposase